MTPDDIRVLEGFWLIVFFVGLIGVGLYLSFWDWFR